MMKDLNKLPIALLRYCLFNELATLIVNRRSYQDLRLFVQDYRGWKYLPKRKCKVVMNRMMGRGVRAQGEVGKSRVERLPFKMPETQDLWFASHSIAEIYDQHSHTLTHWYMMLARKRIACLEYDRHCCMGANPPTGPTASCLSRRRFFEINS